MTELNLYVIEPKDGQPYLRVMDALRAEQIGAELVEVPKGKGKGKKSKK
jgi:hypothetical protein